MQPLEIRHSYRPSLLISRRWASRIARQAGGVHTFTQPCTASWRDGGDSLPVEYRLITDPRVIGPVARDLNDATRNLIQQGRQQTTVVDPARCNLHRHNLFRPLIDTQVQLTPGSAPTMSMLSDVPFTRAVHSQDRRIHNHVPRPTAWANSQERRQGTLSSTESAVVWNWQIESEQLQERRNEALRRPKAKLKLDLEPPSEQERNPLILRPFERT